MISSFLEILPCSINRDMEYPVNCLARDAKSNTVFGVIGISCSKFAKPYPLLRTIFLSFKTRTAEPGFIPVSMSRNIESTFW